jgi:hypothetical protein
VPPAAPSNLNVEAVDSNSIQVQWTDNSANEDGFEVSNDETCATVDADVKNYTWTGLAPGAYVCFQVRAFNIVGSSVFTPAECATTLGSGTDGEASNAATPGTDGGGDGETVEEGEGIWEGVVGAVGDTVEDVQSGRLPDSGPVGDAVESLQEGRLPETGGGRVLLLVGAVLISGGLLLVWLGRRFSR